MRAVEFIIGHVIFKLRYDQIYQLKTTLSAVRNFKKVSNPIVHCSC